MNLRSQLKVVFIQSKRTKEMSCVLLLPMLIMMMVLMIVIMAMMVTMAMMAMTVVFCSLHSCVSHTTRPAVPSLPSVPSLSAGPAACRPPRPALSHDGECTLNSENLGNGGTSRHPLPLPPRADTFLRGGLR